MYVPISTFLAKIGNCDVSRWSRGLLGASYLACWKSKFHVRRYSGKDSCFVSAQNYGNFVHFLAIFWTILSYFLQQIDQRLQLKIQGWLILELNLFTCQRNHLSFWCDQCRQKLKVTKVVECQIYFELVLVPRVHVQFESKFWPNQMDV